MFPFSPNLPTYHISDCFTKVCSGTVLYRKYERGLGSAPYFTHHILGNLIRKEKHGSAVRCLATDHKTRITHCQCAITNIWGYEPFNCAIFCVPWVQPFHMALPNLSDDQHRGCRKYDQHHNGRQYENDKRFHGVSHGFPLRWMPFTKRDNTKCN